MSMDVMSLGGVYRITNLQNSKVYVGSTSLLKRRKADHWQLLRRGAHFNMHLQAAWNKYGEDSFVFSVLVTCGEADLLRLEQQFIDLYLSADQERGYNIAPVAGTCRGYSHTDEAKRRIASAMRGKPKSAAAIARMVASQTGRAVSDEQKRQISATLTGRASTPEAIAKRAAKNTGKKRTAAQRAGMSLAARRRMEDPHNAEMMLQLARSHAGKTRSDESRARMSTAHVGKPLSDKHRRNLSATMTPERRKAISEFHKGKPWTPEFRERMMAARRLKKEQQ